MVSWKWARAEEPWKVIMIPPLALQVLAPLSPPQARQGPISPSHISFYFLLAPFCVNVSGRFLVLGGKIGLFIVLLVGKSV
jgi:hypothetical protein